MALHFCLDAKTKQKDQGCKSFAKKLNRLRIQNQTRYALTVILNFNYRCSIFIIANDLRPFFRSPNALGKEMTKVNRRNDEPLPSLILERGRGELVTTLCLAQILK